MTAWDLFESTKESLPSISVWFSTQGDHEKEAASLEERFSTGKTIKGTQRLHGFYPVSLTALDCKEFSLSGVCRRVQVNGDSSLELELDEIKGFVTVVWNQKWYLASVMDVDTILGEVKLSFLQQCGPYGSFSFPACPDMGIVPSSAILSSVDPLLSERSGRAYKLSNKEIDTANKRLKEFK